MAGEALSFNPTGMNYQNGLTRAYSNYVGLTDSISSFDSDLGSSCLGLNGSIMGGGFGNYGCMGYYGPGPEVRTQEDYLRWQEKMENFQIEKQIRQKEKVEYAEFKTTSSKDAITREIGNLQRQIAENEQDKVVATYGKITEAIRQKFKESGHRNVDEGQVKAYAEKLYYEATGTKISEDIKAHGDSSFVKGLKDGAFFGLGSLLNDKTSSAENIAALSDESVSKSDEVGLWTGRIVAGGASLVALPFALRATKGTTKVLGDVTKKSWSKFLTNEPGQATKLLEKAGKILKKVKK